ncbi:FAD-binding oxidoreductase [Williamsia sp. SKLECPSW1]
MTEPVVADLLTELPHVTHQSGTDAYAAATAPDNSSFPQRPAAVVRAGSADDVARAITVASTAGNRVAVQATGHGAGAPIGPGIVLLDTSALDSVVVDPSARLARVGAGTVWPAVQAVAAQHGMLGLSGTSPTVGVAGYTFTGGVSWFVRKHGLASATLRSVEYVDGAGRIRRAADDAPEWIDREALWAFRGGAPVGIATSVEVGLVAVPELWTGYLLWPAEALPAVAAAWAAATATADPSVTSSLSLLHLPPEGPFPDDLLGTTVVHLSYASPDGGTHLERMRAAVRGAAAPVVDTTAAGDTGTLAQIHLDPPAAVPARGTGRWLGAGAADLVTSMFSAARIGQPGGLAMIELRHTQSRELTKVEGAMTTVPGPFLLHAVGLGVDENSRLLTDEVLDAVEDAGRAADIGRSAPAFREGQPDTADALPPVDLDRLRVIRDHLDPDRVLAFARHPVP